MDQSPKPLRWIRSAKKDLMAMPDEVQQAFGFALYNAQIGLLHPDAKPLKGFGSAGVLEVVEDWRGDTFAPCIPSASQRPFTFCTVFRRKQDTEYKPRSGIWI